MFEFARGAFRAISWLGITAALADFVAQPRARARLQAELLGAAQHFRNADRAGAEAMADLLKIGAKTMEARQDDQGEEHWIGGSRLAALNRHYARNRRRKGSCKRQRQLRLLGQRGVRDHGSSVSITGHDEARRRILAEQREALRVQAITHG